MSTFVPHPGARPGDLAFPAAEARAALLAIEGELDDLTACAGAHDRAAVDVCHGFEGRSRNDFEAWLSEGLAAVAQRRQQLADDAEQLRRWLIEAGRRQAAREAQQRAWHQRMQAYAADQEARRRVPQAR